MRDLPTFTCLPITTDGSIPPTFPKLRVPSASIQVSKPFFATSAFCCSVVTVVTVVVSAAELTSAVVVLTVVSAEVLLAEADDVAVVVATFSYTFS